MKDIDALIAEAEDQLTQVRSIYQESLRSTTVSDRLQVKIKNVLENQRSALEYLASAIVDRYGKAGTRAYFPLAKTSGDFEALFDKQMRGVAASRPDIRDAIQRKQPYQSGCAWLGHLGYLTNENKHRRLSAQTRREAMSIKAGPGGPGVIGRPGGPSIQIGGGASIAVSGGASISFGSGGGPLQEQNIVKTVLVDWLFADLGISALGLLEEIQKELPRALDEVAQAAGL